MKTKIHGKQFTIDQFFIILLSVSLLIGITLVSIAPPLFDWIDKWTDNMSNQLKIFYVVCSVICIFTVRWVVRFLKRS